ncbi:MAG: ComEC/Rec2 family competence protein [Bacteroidota bacterium]
MKFQARNNYLINWPEYPLLRTTICFMVGIFLSDSFDITLQWCAVVLGVLIVFFYCFNRVKKSSLNLIRGLGVSMLFIGILLGVIRGNLQKAINNPFHYSHGIQNESVTIVGKVSSELKRKKRISATINVLSINTKKYTGRLLVYFDKADSLVNYQIGDIIMMRGKVHQIKDNHNPRAFNYREYLKYQGVDYQIFLKDGVHKLVSSGNVNWISGLTIEIRKWAITIFKERIKQKDQFATASAMVLGHRDNISKDLYTSFSETGAVHVLAVSGLHVGIICLIFIIFFNQFKNESNTFKLIKLISLLLVVWTYALITGASPAVLRASVMFSLILIGRLWFKGANIYNILSCSALLILMYDPYLLFQLSFQFSYLALISIVFFQPYFERWFETRHRILNRIWQLTTVSIAAQILIFPISVYHFHEFPTYFVLSGIIAVFLATFILGIGIALLCFNSIPGLGDIISFFYSVLLEGFIGAIEGVQSLPFTTIDGLFISVESVLICYLLIGAIMYLLRLRPTNYKEAIRNTLKKKRIAACIVMLSTIALMINSILHTNRIKNLTELIVYDIYEHTAIDIFDNNQLYSIYSRNVDHDKVDFASKGYRIYNGNLANTTTSLLEKDNLDEALFLTNGSLFFKNHHLYFVDEIETNNRMPCASDILLVVNKTKQLPHNFLEHHRTSLVVLDNSLTRSIRDVWIEECKKRMLRVHDVREHGVFRL